MGTQGTRKMEEPPVSGLTDTDILVDALRGVENGVKFLATQHASGGVRISIISAMELVIGCRNSHELTLLQQFLERVQILPLSATISRRSYQLVQSYFLSHGLLIPDALIASTAIEHGLTLYTKNVRHFRMIPDLNVVRPYD